MAIAFKGGTAVAGATSGSVTSLTVTYPGGAPASTNLIYLCLSSNVAAQPATPTGYAVARAMLSAGTLHGMTLFRRVANGTEGTTLSITGLTSGKWMWSCLILTGADGTTPEDGVTPTTATGTGGTVNAAAITPTTTGAAVLAFGSSQTTSGVTTTAWTDSAGTMAGTVTQTAAAAVNSTAGQSYALNKTGGASYDPNLTLSPTGGVRAAAITIAVRPASAATQTAGATNTVTATSTAASASTKPVLASNTVTATSSADATVVPAGGGVTQSADSSLTVTGTLTGVAATTKPIVANTFTVTAARTAAAASTKPVLSAQTVTATLTGAAAGTKPVLATQTVTATLTAEMTVVSPIAQTATGAITATEASTATAAATKPVAGSLTATAISAASLEVRPLLVAGAALSVSQASEASLEQLRTIRTFRPPVVVERLDVTGQRSLVRVPTTVGISVLKVGGQYHQVRQPANWEMDQAEAVYLGGRIYTVTPEEADDLRAAGYDVSEQLQPV